MASNENGSANTRRQDRVASIDEPIAIIGMGCRFPGGADDPERFWELLRSGADTVREIPPERWDTDALFDPDPAAAGKMIVRHASLLDNVGDFDPQFFNISPREAASMDPQGRLLLEVTWEALEHAAIDPTALHKTETGVFVGTDQNDYAQLQLNAGDFDRITGYDSIGTLFSFFSGRLSYALGVRGASLSVDTACSSSNVALHLACQSLRLGESSLAIVGAVHLVLSPEITISLSKIQALSPEGRSRTFDANANGYGRGEGCAVVILKRLSDAQRDGDNILALIRGSAVNHDGPSDGLMVPSQEAQESLLQRVLQQAGVAPADIDYVEAHGTGTPVGDPIELRALANVIGDGRAVDRPLLVGSVKTNIGHLEAAAGLAGLLKVILALQHEEIPPHLHFETPNPRLDWDALPIIIPTQLRPWPRGRRPRLAGVSSSGLSGTNAYVVVEEPPLTPTVANAAERSHHLLPLSAKSSVALTALAARYADHLAANPATPLADVAFTAATGRAHFDYRAAFVADSTAHLVQQLRAYAALPPAAEPAAPAQRIAWLFTGQGAQYVNMGRDLYQTQPTFRRAIERCGAILADELPLPLHELLYPAKQTEAALAAADDLLAQTRFTQPALFAVEYALAMLWQSWGVTPDVVMGHSIGEYVAACIAGVFSLEDGLRLVAARGRLMHTLPDRGRMIAVQTDEARVHAALAAAGVADEVSIAAVNGPENVVIAGATGPTETVAARLAAAGVKTKPLNVSHAFHSPLMRPMLAAFARVAETVTYRRPTRTMISNVTGEIIDDAVTTPNYWVDHVMRTVRFADGVATLRDIGCDVVLECGPRPTLLSLAQQSMTDDAVEWLPSLRLGHDAWHVLLTSLGRLYERRQPVDWHGFDADYSRRKRRLPTYPFQRQRYWVPTAAGIPGTRRPRRGANLLPGERLKLPFTPDIHFQTAFSAAAPSYLADHQLWNTIIVPGASHVVHMLQGVHTALKHTAVVLEDVVFTHALGLDEDSTVTLQLVLTPQDATTYQAQIASSADIEADEPTWIRHAAARLNLALPAPPAPPNANTVQARCPDVRDWPALAAVFAEAGYAYGPSFTRLDRVWIGDGEYLGRMPADPSQSSPYLLHPGVLDACFQLAVAGEIETLTAQGGLFVPFSINRMTFHGTPAADAALYCHCQVHPADPAQPNARRVDLVLFQADGRLIAELDTLELRRAARRALLSEAQPDYANWFYSVAWRAQPLPEHRPSLSPAQLWLLFDDQDGVACRLAEQLEEVGQHVWRVRPGERFTTDGDRLFWISPDRPADVERLLALAAESGWPLAGVVNLWGAARSANAASLSPTDLAPALRRTLAGTLNLAHHLSAAPDAPAPRLWLVTRGAVNAADSGVTNVPPTALWGLGQVIGLELPELRCVRYDLDPDAAAADAAAMLFAELRFDQSAEDQVAARGGERYVARLTHNAVKHDDRLPVPSGPYRLNITQRGTPANLYYEPVSRRRPDPHEVEIEVRATGQNFKDILNALGLYQGDAGPFGGECAGVVTAVGRDVTDFAPGDAVLALTFGSYSRYATVDTRRVVHKPNSLSFAEAATIPVTFLTAYYGLHTKARLAAGERVLIHSAAGGIGLAAVQLARLAGAEIVATASRPKWAYLRRHGIEHIFDSRSLDFGDDIAAALGPNPIDVALNALPDAYIPRTLQLLARDGRFIEIGKQGIWSADAVHAAYPGVAYHIIDLFETAMRRPDLIANLFAELMPHFETGKLQPLPRTVYGAGQVIQSFRAMQHGRHIGKFVVTHNTTERDPNIRPDGAYLITGGLGGLGLAVAQALAANGARHLVLSGRAGITTDAQQAAVDTLRRAGVAVTISRADVADAAAVEALMAQIDALPVPLRGVFHAAGVLDDGVLRQLSWERFVPVLAPKAHGGWLLHKATQDRTLDHFVLFSSVASLLGSAGQANYAAGNAFLDGLARYRRALGLPALSIAWGPWAEVGMAADQAVLEQWHQRGLQSIAVDAGLDALLQLLAQETPPVVGVAPIAWDRYVIGPARPFLSECVSSRAPDRGNRRSVPDQLAATPPAKRRDMAAQIVQAEVARVLGFADPAEVAIDESFNRLGMDSLTAVELRNRLQNVFATQLSATIVFNYPTTGQMVDFLLQKIRLADGSGADGVTVGIDDGQAAAEAAVEALSAEQIESALTDELGEIEALLAGGKE